MISLRYNQIEDIRPLANMRGLYYLNLRHNNICDISILSRFKNITSVAYSWSIILSTISCPLKKRSPGWQRCTGIYRRARIYY